MSDSKIKNLDVKAVLERLDKLEERVKKLEKTSPHRTGGWGKQ